MNDETLKTEGHRNEPTEPALTPLGIPPEAPAVPRGDEAIHTGPEFAVGEGDVRSAEAGEIVAGSSLWKDAWRRLRKNKLAVFGMIVVVLCSLCRRKTLAGVEG